MSMELKGGADLRGDIAQLAEALRTDGGNATANRILQHGRSQKHGARAHDGRYRRSHDL